MKAKTVISPEKQPVAFVELFFDLVFVFSITQIVGLLHQGLNWAVVGQAVLIFWLVWWAWTQFTWALNAADTTHHGIGLGTLVATAVAFFMAAALPDAFHERSLWFALAYVVVRVIGLVINAWVVSQDPSRQAAIQKFTLISIGGLIAVMLGGFLGGTLQYLFWGLAIVLDFVAAAAGASTEGIKLHPEHFAERHGLFVIIALGETLIVAAGEVSHADWTGNLISVAILAVAITCALWWSYFPRAKPELDHAFESSKGAKQSMMARDVFSMIHFPMLCGIIAYAVAIEEVIVHPDVPLPLAGRLALAVGLVLFVGGMATAIWRATNHLHLPRVLVIVGTAIAIVVVANASVLVTLIIAFVGILLIISIEHWSGNPLPEKHHKAGLQHEG